jgi:3,4-dihydroxy 2-butanone 4-phosphate synthase/GTP cyclohydrolase II
MATHARGLISLALTEERMRALGLSLITDDQRQHDQFQTAFATPIDAREGVGSGMSAHDRARTIAVAIADGTRPADLIRPGRLQTLRALDGGVLARRGHTEAAVDLARLAGLKPAGVICEIMNDGRHDGAHAGARALRARSTASPILRIEDPRRVPRERAHDRRRAETVLPTAGGRAFRLIVYADSLDTNAYVALIKGSPIRHPVAGAAEHSQCLTGDGLRLSSAGDCGEQLDSALAMIGCRPAAACSCTCIDEGRGLGLLNKTALTRSG